MDKARAGKAQYQSNVAEWDIRQTGPPLGLHYKVAMNARYHKSVPILL